MVFFVVNFKIKTMKKLWNHITNIWSKIPAWVKVILINLFILIPVISLSQTILQLNFLFLTNWGWAILIVVPFLYGFWKLAQRISRFNRPEDVKIEFKVNFKNIKTWLRILGLILFTGSSITLFTILFDAQSEDRNAFFESFYQFEALTAIPLLIGIALTAGIVEEVAYRGYIQNILVRQYPKYAAFIGIGVLFAVMHFLPLSLILPYLIVSMTFSLVADEYKSLGVVIIAHVIVDIIFLMISYYSNAADFDFGPLAVVGLGAICMLSIFCLLYKSEVISKLFNRKRLALR
jgi:membrane protease YdiL (CAAX protease family)